MNPMPIHTSVYPSYNYLAAENSFLKQNIEYKDAVLYEQQKTISDLKQDVQALSSANSSFKQQKDQAEADALRWKTMKKIIESQGGKTKLKEVEDIVNKDIVINKTGGLK